MLKEVDPEVGAAAARVAALGPGAERQLAERFLVLGDRTHPGAIERLLVAQAQEAKARLAGLVAVPERGIPEAAQAEIDGFLSSLTGEERRDPVSGLRVTRIEVYEGAWKTAPGGIKVIYENGTSELRKGGFMRRVPTGRTDDPYVR